MNGDITTLRDHIDALAKAFDIELQLSSTIEQFAGHIKIVNNKAVIVGHTIDDDVSYVVAMHEIGHYRAPSGMIRAHLKFPSTFEGSLRKLRAMIEEEHAAWEWAEKNVLRWTKAMEEAKRFALSTYEDKLWAGEMFAKMKLVNEWK